MLNFETEIERKKTCLIALELKEDNLHITDNILNKYSNLMTMLRVTAWCMRYVKILLNKINGKFCTFSKYVTVKEIDKCLSIFILRSQELEFRNEINVIKKEAKLYTKSKLRNLEPFVDENGILRVGGRLHYASCLPFEQQHPVILHKNDRLSFLLVHYYHHKLLHGTGQLLESNIRLKYWIIGIKYLIKQVVRKCVTCVRYKAEACKQKMASLPSYRFRMDKPFVNTGIDYAGPLIAHIWKGRGAKHIKCFIALFICMSTMTLHLELVMDSSTVSFVAALKRVVARRGTVCNIYSDNGTNFHGAVRHLKKVHEYFTYKLKNTTKY